MCYKIKQIKTNLQKYFHPLLLKPTYIFVLIMPRAKAKGSNFKEDERGIAPLGVITECMVQVDLYHHISIIETLAHNKWISLLASYIIITPNMKPVSQKLLGIDIPGAKTYPVRHKK